MKKSARECLPEAPVRAIPGGRGGLVGTADWRGQRFGEDIRLAGAVGWRGSRFAG